MNEPTTNNQNVILIVVSTVCIAALIGIVTEAICVFYKIPDMNTQLAGGFTHVVDTVIGALIAMLINTRATSTQAAPTVEAGQPAEVKIVNKPSQPVPTVESEPTLTPPAPPVTQDP